MELTNLATNLTKVRTKLYPVSNDPVLIKDIVEDLSELSQSNTNLIVDLSDIVGDISDIEGDIFDLQQDVTDLQALKHEGLYNVSYDPIANTTATTVILGSISVSTAHLETFDGIVARFIIKSAALDTWIISCIADLVTLPAVVGDPTVYMFEVFARREIGSNYKFSIRTKITLFILSGGAYVFDSVVYDGYKVGSDGALAYTTRTAVNDYVSIQAIGTYTGAGTPTPGELTGTFFTLETHPLNTI